MITIPGQIIKMDTETGIDPIWYDKLQTLIATANLFASDSGGSGTGSRLNASLGADVLLTNTANYFLGPSIAQGTSGTWFVSGTVTLTDPAAAGFFAKLWDGTTVIASSAITLSTGTGVTSISLSGFIASPADNLRISVRDASSVNGKILFNGTGTSRDSTISAFRIA